MTEPFRVRRGTAYYTSRDLIIYAFGIGCYESQDQKEQRQGRGQGQKDQPSSEISYLYEHNNQFSAFPTFPLTLNFRAHGREEGNLPSPSALLSPSPSPSPSLAFDLPEFPPPMMKGPDADLSRLGIPFQSMIGGPVIHLSEKYHLHRTIPITRPDVDEEKPIRVELRTRIVSILPKKRATIVITETNYYLERQNEDVDVGADNNDADAGENDDVELGPLLATSQSTTLYPIVLETSQKIIQPPPLSSHGTPSIFSSNIQGKSIKGGMNRNRKRYSTKPSAKKSYIIPKHQALMYRLSGDTNAIHVVGSPAMFQSTRPILHGLCTLGYAVRAVQCSYGQTILNDIGGGDSADGVEQMGKLECRHVECQFTKPLFVGDEIEVRMWWDGGDNDGGGNGNSGNVADNDENKRNVVQVLFQVRNVKDDVIVVDGGIAYVHFHGIGGLSSRRSQADIHSKL